MINAVLLQFGVITSDHMEIIDRTMCVGFFVQQGIHILSFGRHNEKSSKHDFFLTVVTQPFVCVLCIIADFCQLCC